MSTNYGCIRTNQRQCEMEGHHRHHSDRQLVSPSVVATAIFVSMHCGRLVAIISKIFDDLLLSGIRYTTDPIIKEIAARVEIITIVHGPGHLRYFCPGHHQYGNCAKTLAGDDKLEGIGSISICRLRSRDLVALLPSVASRALPSLNSTAGRLGRTA